MYSPDHCHMSSPAGKAPDKGFSSVYFCENSLYDRQCSLWGLMEKSSRLAKQASFFFVNLIHTFLYFIFLPIVILRFESHWLVVFLPVSSTRAARQAKAEASRFRLWRWVEKSRTESSHSPNPRRHWNLCSTKPLQNTSLSSDNIDLRRRGKRR